MENMFWCGCVLVCYKVLPFMFDKKPYKVNSLLVAAVSLLISFKVDQVHGLTSTSVKSSVMSLASTVDKVFIVANEDLATNSHLFCASPRYLCLLGGNKLMRNQKCQVHL